MIEQFALWRTRQIARRQLIQWQTRIGEIRLRFLALLLIMFTSLVYGLADTVQGIERGLLWPVVWIGLILGWLLAHSRLSGWQAAMGSLLAGVILTLLRVGRLGVPFVLLLGRAARLAWQVVQRNVAPNAAPVQLAWVELGSSAGALIGRLHTWFVALAEGQQLFDPVVIALLWSLALWGTVVWASWAVGRRAQPVWGAAPAVALLASILSYAGGRALYLLPMLAPTLVLKALTWYDSRRRHWEQDGIEHAPRIRANTGWTAVGLSLALMVVAALTPSVSVYRIVDYVRSVPRQWVQVDEPEAAARSVGLEPRPETEDSNVLVAMASAQRAGGLPASHLIGSGPELSEQLIMIVSDETEFEPNRTSALRPTPRYYWRGTTYDRYTGRGWCTRDVTVVDYAAGELAVPTPWGSRRLLRQEIHAVEDNDGLLYVAGSLVTADQEYQVAWRLRPEAGERGDAFGATTKATRYRTDSLLPVIGEADLRAAGQDYPVSVVDRYLALPDSVPDRVSALARDLTATELTPYDRALAIIGYLRSFPYTLDLPAPPVDRDIADYFLFDLQEGYCDYYATAMVVLARAAGLPARLVTGYASGDYNEAEAQYVVTAEQAHSWAEIYFPGYGWIEFEPTADRPAIERPAGALSETSPRPETPLEPITARRARASRTRYLRIGGGLLVLVVGVVLTWPVVDGWRLGRLSAKARVTCLLRRLYRHGRWLGVLSRRGDTLHEFAAALVMRVKDLAEMRSWGAVLVSVPAEIDWLTDLCVRFLYSSHQPGVGEQAQAVRTWRRLRRRLWLAILFTSIPRSEAVRSHRENAE